MVPDLSVVVQIGLYQTCLSMSQLQTNWTLQMLMARSILIASWLVPASFHMLWLLLIEIGVLRRESHHVNFVQSWDKIFHLHQCYLCIGLNLRL